MGSGKAHFGRRGLKKTPKEKTRHSATFNQLHLPPASCLEIYLNPPRFPFSCHYRIFSTFWHTWGFQPKCANESHAGRVTDTTLHFLGH